jgi:hypothetical protein
MYRLLEKFGIKKSSSAYRDREDDEEPDIARVLRHNQTLFYNILKKDKLDQLKALDEVIRQAQAKTIISKSDALECKICMDKRVDMCLVPCGHCFCSNCINKASKCYICTREIFIKQKLYI